MTRRTTSRRPDRATVTAAAQAHAETQAAARAARTAERLPIGELAYDTRRKRKGVVMDHLDGYVWLRPQGGGTEWTAQPGDVEPAASEGAENAVLRARVAVANARSRGEVL
ncbi:MULTISPECIES: hypothetical protein [unclassified Streptomyces]|uniref:hypothetical protein n=1 Tax=unclassified Streptomyces TaxID=2593676 RepID=UPI00404247CA